MPHHRRGRRAGLAWAVCFTLLTSAAKPASAVDGRILHVGYPSSAAEDFALNDTGGTDKFRPGCWVPISVELYSDENAPLFEGRLRILEPDRDGDLAAVEEPVVVRGTRRFWLYAMRATTRGDEPFRVELLDAQGNVVKMHDRATGAPVEHLEPKQRPVALRTEDLVVLDISQRPVSPLYRLATQSSRQTESGLVLTRSLVISRQAAVDLPPHWCGLDMADVVVWDGADPDGMTDKDRQLTALTEWVRRGGVLVLGVARTWQSVQKSSLASLLPGEMRAVETADSLPELSEYLKGSARWNAPIAICPLDRATLRPGARAFYQRDGAADRLLLCRRTVGRGQVVFVGAELRDLYGLPGDRDELTMRLLGLRQGPSDESAVGEIPGRELFPLVSRTVGFETKTALYFLFAIAFVISYILAGTLGAWQWLKAHQWQRYNWTAFAALALAASALSLGAVRVIRGVGRDVQELSVVDMQAGSFEAVARSYFGVKTATHERLDLLLPGDWTQIDPTAESMCTLQPMPPDPVFDSSTYVVPYEYRMRPAYGRLEDVAFRATLKQFEGSWRGEMTGRIVASLTCTRDGNIYWLDGNAWIRNDLGVDLHGCLLIQAVTDPYPNVAQRWGAQAIRAYPIGDPISGGVLRKGQTLTRLNAQAYGESGGRRTPALADLQTNWANRVGVRAESYRSYRDRETLSVTSDVSEAALLLASTFTEFKPATAGLMGSSHASRTYLRHLDVSELLRRDVMMFVGFSSAPGPTRICYRPAGSGRDFRPLNPSSAITMYRVLIPITLRE